MSYRFCLCVAVLIAATSLSGCFKAAEQEITSPPSALETDVVAAEAETPDSPTEPESTGEAPTATEKVSENEEPADIKSEPADDQPIEESSSKAATDQPESEPESAPEMPEESADNSPEPSSLPGASAQTNLLLSELPEMANELPADAETSAVVLFEPPAPVSLKSNAPPTPVAAERFYLGLEAETDPKAAIQRIDSFLEFYELTETQTQLIQQQRQVWEGRARENFVKSGEHFIPADEVLKKRDQMHSDLSSVIQLAETGQPTEAIVAALERISAEHEESVMPYYIAGLVKAIWLNESRDALADFRRVLREIPGHAGALNNIAVCEMKTGDYGRALGNWRKAVEGDQLPVSRAEILHNIRYAHRLALSTNTKMPTSFADAAARLLSESQDTLSDKADESSGFWRYSPWVDRPEQVTHLRGDHSGGSTLRLIQRPVKTTHGIALGRDLLLVPASNLSMPYLGRSQHIRVKSKNVRSSGRSGLCRSVAINDELGMVLLECSDLATPLLTMATALPAESDTLHIGERKDESAITFQAAGFEAVSKEIASLFATVSPPAEISEVGMPVFDTKGDLAGVLSPLFTTRGDQEVRYAWSAPLIRSFVKSAPVQPLAWPVIQEEGNWETRQQFLKDHIVEIELCYPQEMLSLERVNRSKFNPSHYLADHSCFVCSGRAYVGCDQKGCANGSISFKYREMVSRTIKGEPVYATKTGSKRCTRCSGHGKLSCANCRDGIEPTATSRPSSPFAPSGFLSR